MELNNNLIATTLLIVVITCTLVAPFPQYEDGASSSNKEQLIKPALWQQQDIEKNFEMLKNMQMGASTEGNYLKDVRGNISDKFSNEYPSINHESDSDNEMGQKNLPLQPGEYNLEMNANVYDYDTEIPLSKNTRGGRLLATTTTTVPQYIRRHGEAGPVLSQTDIDLSLSDYVEDEVVEQSHKHATKMPVLTSLDNSSEENDDILPLAMKFYNEIPPENSSSTRHVEAVSSEDYYEEEYHEPAPTTTSTSTINDDSYNFSNTVTGSGSMSDLATTKSAPTPTPTATPTQPSLTTMAVINIPVMEQIDPLLLTTPAPLPSPTPATPTVETQTQTQIMSGTSTNGSASGVSLSDKKGKQIPIISTVPVITTTSTTSSSRRRLLPHEQLRNYIEDAYIRMPLAVIIDPSAESLEKTKRLWNDAMRTNLNIKIVLVTLNESQEKSPAAFNFNNTRQFLTGLNSIKEQNSGDVFRGISHAAELVPYDSAVFISTAQLAKHTDQVQDSAITLLKKRIRLYLIWFGERSLSENETQDSVGGILGEVAIRSGGEILHIVSNENSQELEGSTLTIVADALRGSQEVDVPVDTTLSSVHVKIDKLMRRAVLETPNGDINLKKLVKFKTQALTTFDDDDDRLDAYVPIAKLRKPSIYKLKVTPEDLTTEYSVFIRGERKADTFLDDMIKHFEANSIQTSHPSRLRISKWEQRSEADSEKAFSTHSKLQFPNKSEDVLPKDEIETFSVTDTSKHSLNSQPNALSPLAITTSLPQPKNLNVFYRTNTKIEMGVHSQILLVPGTAGQLYFEVTNTGYEGNIYNIQVVDERRYLMRLTPQSLYLRAGQIATATVSVFVPENTQANTIDHITFSASTSVTTTSLTVKLKVLNTIDNQDNTPPSISWSFGSRCEEVSTEFDSCSERFWNLYITAQDWQSGILRLQATPSSGLVYTKSYLVGTTEPLKASYVASCCETRVSLVAFDGAGNQRTHNIDVRDLLLTEASIAAIVLGVILIVLLVALMIAAIIWCCRRRKIVLDIPTYRSHSTRSME